MLSSWQTKCALGVFIQNPQVQTVILWQNFHETVHLVLLLLLLLLLTAAKHTLKHGGFSFGGL